jgi:hypothetical protein
VPLHQELDQLSRSHPGKLNPLVIMILAKQAFCLRYLSVKGGFGIRKFNLTNHAFENNETIALRHRRIQPAMLSQKNLQRQRACGGCHPSTGPT